MNSTVTVTQREEKNDSHTLTSSSSSSNGQMMAIPKLNPVEHEDDLSENDAINVYSEIGKLKEFIHGDLIGIITKLQNEVADSKVNKNSAEEAIISLEKKHSRSIAATTQYERKQRTMELQQKSRKWEQVSFMPFIFLVVFRPPSI